MSVNENNFSNSLMNSMESLNGNISKNEKVIESKENISPSEFIEKLKRRIFDDGVNKDRVLYINGEKKVAPAVQINTRNTFTLWLLQKLSTENITESINVPTRNFWQHVNSENRNAFIYKIDLENVFNASQAKDRYLNNAGDYNINLAAQAVIEAEEEISKILPNFEHSSCRYGGDEFALALISTSKFLDHKRISAEILNNVKFIIKEKIQSKLGYFGENFEQRQLKLKNDLVEEIRIPSIDPIDPRRRIVFFKLLKENRILNSKEISKYLKNYDSDNNQFKINEEISALDINFNSKEFEEIEDIYFQAINSGIDFNQLGRLYNRRRPFRLADIKFLLYDSHLKSEIDTFSWLERGISQRKNSHLISFDIKFLKEINDNRNENTGNELISVLFNSIRNKLTEEEFRSIIKCRRGGTFVLDISDINNKDIILNKLKSLDSIDVFGIKNVPLGFSEKKIESFDELLNKNAENNYRLMMLNKELPADLSFNEYFSLYRQDLIGLTVRNELDVLFSKSDKNWYIASFNKIQQEINKLDDKIDNFEDFKIPMDLEHFNPTLLSLYGYFFTSNKRGISRCEQGIKIIKESLLNGENFDPSEIYSLLENTLKKLIEKKELNIK